MKKDLIVLLGFLFIEISLWVAILFLHLPFKSGVLHFTSIVVCFIYLMIQFERKTDYFIVYMAMVFTVVADYFLTLQGTHQILGTFFFLLAQISYMVRLHIKHHQIKLKSLIPYISLILFLLVMIAGVILSQLDLLLLVSISYYSFLIMNLVFAMIQFKKNPLFALGLLCYICCDTLVGLSASGPYITFEPGSIIDYLIHPGINLIWMFYLPSQVLITLSTKYLNQLKGVL